MKTYLKIVFLFVCIALFPLTGNAMSVERIDGADRYATAQKVSAKAFEFADYVILASGETYADALGASSLSQALQGPILLARKNEIPEVTMGEITRLQARNIVVIGGENTISKEIVEKLQDMHIGVERIWGETRYETANEIAQFLQSKSEATNAFVVDGRNFPDALSAGAVASIHQWPILYASNDGRHPSKEILNEYQLQPIVVGGENSVPSKILDGTTFERLEGPNRYTTALAVAKTLPVNTTTVILADGRNYADALVSAGLAGVEKSAVLLVGTEFDPTVKDYLVSNPYIQHVYIVGGDQSVSASVMSQVQEILSAKKENVPPTIEGPSTAQVIQSEIQDVWKSYKVADDKDTLELLQLEIVGKDLKESTPGVYKVTLKATDSEGLFAEKNITLYILEKTGTNVKNPDSIKSARLSMVEQINQEREKRYLDKGYSSSGFIYQELDNYAMKIAQKWAEEKTDTPPKISTDIQVVSILHHKGFKQPSNVFKALMKDQNYMTSLMRKNGIPNKELTSVVYGIGVAVDDEGQYYWVVTTGGRISETAKELKQHDLNLAAQVPKFSMKDPFTNPIEVEIYDKIDLCAIVQATQPYPNKIIDPSKFKITEIRKDGQLIPLSDFNTKLPATYQITYRVEGYFGEVSEPFTVTIKVVMDKTPGTREPAETEPETTEPITTDPEEPVDPTPVGQIDTSNIIF